MRVVTRTWCFLLHIWTSDSNVIFPICIIKHIRIIFGVVNWFPSSSFKFRKFAPDIYVNTDEKQISVFGSTNVILLSFLSLMLLVSCTVMCPHCKFPVVVDTPFSVVVCWSSKVLIEHWPGIGILRTRRTPVLYRHQQWRRKWTTLSQPLHSHK